VSMSNIASEWNSTRNSSFFSKDILLNNISLIQACIG
jgi:hypothetical protein